MRSGKAQRFVLVPTKSQTVEAARAQNRKAGLPAWCRGFGGAFGQYQSRYQVQVDETVSEPPEAGSRSSRSISAPDGTGAGASAGRLEADLECSQELLGTGIETPGVKCFFGSPHAGESGVDRKVGPISLWPAESRPAWFPSPPMNRSESATNRSGS